MGPARVVWNGIRGMAEDCQDFMAGQFWLRGYFSAAGRGDCLNCDFGEYGDGQDTGAFAIWGCRSAVGTGLEDGRFVCCWVFQELGGGARTEPGRLSRPRGGRGRPGDGLGAEGR